MIEWRCANGHVLGLILHGRYARLLLVDPRAWPLIPFATISGAAEVTCLVCGDVRQWRFGEDLKERLTIVL